MILVGLVGKAYSGKTTAAKALVEQHGFVRVSFANALKEMAVKYFECTPEQVYTTKPAHVRTILQGLGSCFREEVNKNFWVDYLMEQIQNLDKVVVDDLRFCNEAVAVRQHGIVIKLAVTGSPHQLEGAQAQHESEAGIDQIEADYSLLFDYGSVTALQETVCTIVKEVVCLQDTLQP
jgi:hypothetical protein